MKQWVEWQGGDRPVGKNAWVNFIVRGDDRIHSGRAGDIAWVHSGTESDVLRYQVTDDTVGQSGAR